MRKIGRHGCKRSDRSWQFSRGSEPSWARAWIGGADLKAAMEKAGVVGTPSFHFSV